MNEQLFAAALNLAEDSPPLASSIEGAGNKLRL
jgi:hypothetical protein